MTWTEPDKITTKAERRLAFIFERLEALLTTLPELRRMAEGATEASEVRGRRPSDPDDPGIRGQGSPPTDVTYELATDPSRAAVASSRRTADRHLLQAIAHLEGARNVLVRGLDRWDGKV